MVGMERPSLSSRGTPGAYGGYFTKEDIREIVTYAAERHITVIPEIEFPAHSDAVFIGYPELCCTGKPYTTGEFCVGNEQVYTFMEDVLTEVMELFLRNTSISEATRPGKSPGRPVRNARP